MQSLTSAPARIEPIRRRPITEQVIECLIPAIGAGAISPGYRLAIDKLAAEFGVSRAPVREAAQELSLQGILRERPGRGWEVAPFDDRQIREVCSVRIALETMMLSEAIQKLRSDPAQFMPLYRAIDEMKRAAQESNADVIRQADVSFHRLAISMAENTLGLSIWEGISRQVMIIFGFEIHQKPELDLAAVVEQHQRLRRFLAEGHPSELEAVLKEHITGQKPCVGLPSERAHQTK